MRLEKVILKGWVPFGEEVSLDLSLLGDAKLIALVGPNGSGKSTLVELAMLGAPYRQLLTRGKLSELAVRRDAFVESTIVNGARYTIRQTCDAVSGGGECLVLDEDGQPLPNSDTKTSWGKQWAADHLPDFDVLTSGLFSAQGSEGLLEASPVERKRLILKAVGVDRFEAMAQRARERAREASALVATLQARTADERSRGGDVQALEGELAKAREKAAQADVEVSRVRMELDGAREAAAAAVAAERDYRAAIERRAKLLADVEQSRAQLADIERRVANNRAVLAEGDAIRAAASELESKRQQLATAQVDAERQRAALARRSSEYSTLTLAVSVASDRQARAAERLAEADAIRAAVEQLADLEHEAARAEAALRRARAALDELHGQQLAGADERIDGLRGGLQSVVDEGAEIGAGHHMREHAVRALRYDDTAVEFARVFPERVHGAQGDVQRLATDHAHAVSALQVTRSKAAKAEALQQAQADRDAALAEIEELTSGIVHARDAIEEARRAEEIGQASIANLEGAIESLGPTASKLAPLQHAEARLAELEPQLEALSARLATLQAELTGTPEPSQPSPAPDVSAFQRAAEAAEWAQRQAHSDAVLLESQLQTAQESEERVRVLEAELAAGNAELADWTRLAADLGKDGLQAAETDAIGPELTELTNDLLHTCFSTRWTVRIETQRASADGKRAIEGCEIKVLDCETGQDCDARRYSGGQRAIIGEAVSLALAMIACNRAGVTAPTLVRDESDAALNDENAEAYAKMLRRAAAHVGADRVLVISHKEALVGLCDAVIEVGGGKVTVR